MKINDSIANFMVPKSVPTRDAHDTASAIPSAANGGAELSKMDSSLRAVSQAEKSAESTASNNKEMEKQVDEALNKANQFFQDDNRSLQFVRDKDTEKMVILIKDMKTDEVIRQIPSEAMLKLAKQLEQVQGILFEEKA